MKTKSLLLLLLVFITRSILNSQPTIDDPFFQKVKFRGAFGTVDWTKGWANWDPQNTNYPAATVVIPAGEITQNTTWTKDKVYLLDGWVYVVDGVTLTIEAGTIIRGSKANKGSLIIEPGAKIIANGTKEQPIVFTSNEPAGQRNYGDWGGLIICGRAPVNQVSPQIEGGPRTIYGGNNSDDSSGVLRYVRIEFPGIAFQPDKEINGLTLAGVGRKTVIENIQVSYCGDDSYEWFGGNVNARYLIAFRGWDDDFDTDYGYSGMVQFAVSLRDPQVADPQSKSNSFESDNDAQGSTNQPYTSALFSNVSSFGPLSTKNATYSSNYLRGMHLRRNTKIQIYNTVVAGWPTGLYIEGPSVTNALNNELKIENSILAGMLNNFGIKTGEWTIADERNWYMNADRRNDTVVNNADLMIEDPFNLTNPNFMPKSNSPLLNGSCWTVSSVTVSTNNNQPAAINQAGGTLQLIAKVEPQRAIDKTVTWSVVSGSNVVSVNQNGLVTALAPGTAKVRATANDGSGKYGEIDINVTYTAISENVNDNLKVYINKLSKELIWEANYQIQNIEIYNLTGELIANVRINSNVAKMNINNVNNGIYIVKLITNEGIKIKKIFVN